MNILPTARGWQLLQQVELAIQQGQFEKAGHLGNAARAYLSFPTGTDDDAYTVWFTWAAVAGQSLQLDFTLQTVTNSTVLDSEVVWNFNDPGFTTAIVNKALTANVATLTTNGNHGLVVGQIIRVALTTPDAVFDGVQTVTAVPSATTFSYNKTNANVASVAAPGTFDIRGGATAVVRKAFSANGNYFVTATVDSAANPAVGYATHVDVPYKAPG